MSRIGRKWALAALVLSAVACGGAAEDGGEDLDEDGEFDVAMADGKADAIGIGEGTPLAAGMLRVANELVVAKLAATSDVGLGTRAANAIGKARAGSDKVEGSSDDVKFTTLTALDKVSYVGPAAFRKLKAYALAHGFVAANPLAAQSTRVPWSGFWWSMLNGELTRGWSDGKGRQNWTEAQVLKFDVCISQYTAECKTLINEMAANNGVKLSPLMKFDFYVRKLLEDKNGAGGRKSTEYSHAAKWEIQHHYIGQDTNHRYWGSRGYAGKCIGWALANLENDEPTTEVTIGGVTFTPADIKGFLAAIYNGAQFFIPENAAVGREFHHNPGSDTPEIYADVTPDDFVRALFETIGKGKMLEGDLDPGDGVWNYPIYKYVLTHTRQDAKTLSVKATIYYANDEVGIDQVFSINPARPDILSRDLTFELSFAAAVSDDLSKATGGRWTGAAVDTHPDVLLTGLESGWRESIYDYRNTQMNTEVNFALLKRVKRGIAWVPLVDEILKEYYAKQKDAAD